MKNLICMTKLFLGLALAFPMSVQAQSAGEVMFIAFDADTDDGFAVVALVDIAANTTVYFSDRNWTGSNFDVASSEGTFSWGTGGSIIAAGTVVTFTGVQSAGSRAVSVGSVTAEGGSFNLSGSDEVLLMYLGTDADTPTTFLSGVGNDGLGNLTGTGLADGVNAIAITGDEDVALYTGLTDCNSTVAACAAQIATVGSWTTEDGSGDQSQDGDGNDFPDNVPASFGGTALPVELINFSGYASQDGVQLQWETASEVNNDYFVLSRSVDGVSFTEVATVNGNGTTSTGAKYSFNDRYASLEIVYYQLTQVDYDGTMERFPLIAVMPGNSYTNSYAYPNPTIGKIEVYTDRLIKAISVSDLSGRIVKIVETPDIDLADLKAGNYLLLVDYVSGREVIRVRKQDGF